MLIPTALFLGGYHGPDTPFAGVALACPSAQRTTDLSSAEDRTSSPVLPSQPSSNSAPEEFAVDSHQENRNQRGSSAPVSEGSNQVELSASDTPAQGSEET